MTITLPEPAAPPDEESTETRVITVGVLKGGTGKSRLAMLIALILAVVFRRRVVVFDADSASQTSMKWMDKAKLRGYAWPFEVIRHPFETLDQEIDKIRARGDVDDIIVDVGGGNLASFLAAVRRSNILLVPLCPDEGDIEQAPQTREAALMGAARNTVGGVVMFYLLNRCSMTSNDRVSARNVLLDERQADGPFPLCDIELPQLVAYQRSFGRIPGQKVPDDAEDHIRWKDLSNFAPLLIETGVLTAQQAVDASLITHRELKDANILTPEELEAVTV
ncbi:ParA family protein [Kitasatospora viridis]|uniref:Chromosome partitioning protein n=1 Tax=Kitasatospora viridis TaxID=281105 RepID=A0A561S9U5_9ACTN|nr:ParA family protein [Kitasatospora viridis]TWF71648.1 chromosome partitioning protein [Kitasatospora viridis]